MTVAITSTIIPLSIFTQFFHRRFSKHIYLETTLELLQQAYIRMEFVTQCYDYFPGDKCLFSLKCSCCQSGITASGSIAETLYHAPIAIILHWGFFTYQQPTTDFELKMIPMLFGSMDAFQRCRASFEKSLEGYDEDLLHHQCADSRDTRNILKHSTKQRRLTLQKPMTLTTMTFSRALYPSSPFCLKILGPQSRYILKKCKQKLLQ